MQFRKAVGSAVLAAAAVGALSGVGAGLASANPVEFDHGDDGLVTYDFGVDGQDVIMGNSHVTWP